MILRPTGKPAQQLMSLLWAETHAPHARGIIFASTRKLITAQYVRRCEDGLHVQLTVSGRAYAREMAATPQGIAYMLKMEEDA